MVILLGSFTTNAAEPNARASQWGALPPIPHSSAFVPRTPPVRIMARESDALIYAMGIFEGTGIQLSLEELAGPGLLEEITEASGGRLFPVSDVNLLPAIAARIGVELHNQYVVAYSPNAIQHDGRHHRVRVQVEPPAGMSALNVDWRAGYRAPIQ